MCDMYTGKAKHIHKGQTHLLVREDVIYYYYYYYYYYYWSETESLGTAATTGLSYQPQIM
jgi:hypothetical protein